MNKKYFLFFFSIYISSIDTISFILNSPLLNVILSTASYRASNRKLFSNIVRARNNLNKKQNRRALGNALSKCLSSLLSRVRGKRTLIEGVSVIYSESIINLLSVARAEQHGPRRVTWKSGKERRDKRLKTGKRDVYVVWAKMGPRAATVMASK